ncbi:hypothetical protein FMN63_21090 [Stappia sp. BW2]|uniref:hypothetical protein n=1 Tax=Stappia sp. BW2 TaxID=2592622 RepID=UPI0011DED24C|nr:hypothetical protein [Stappia sp. BW2]TYC64947.1 hypothetical protein FMN63_21090 [Stappia sp. BW2]
MSRQSEASRYESGVNELAQARDVCPGLDAPHPSKADMTGQALISKIAQKNIDVSESCLLGGFHELSFRLRPFFKRRHWLHGCRDKKLS